MYNSEPYIHLRSTDNRSFKWILSVDNEIMVCDSNVQDKFDVNHKFHDLSIKLPFPFQTCIDVKDCEIELQDKCVYEFYFDKKSGLLRPHIIRFDKSSKGYNGTNHLTIASDIWDSIHNFVSRDVLKDISLGKLSISKNDIKYKTLSPSDMKQHIDKRFSLRNVFSGIKGLGSFNNNIEESSTESPIWRIRKFHNFVKSHLIEKYCNNSHRLTFDYFLKYLGATYNNELNGYELPNYEPSINYLITYLGITR